MTPGPIPAAGTVPWRVRHGTLEVALVHRPRYDDWSWPKGKLDDGEEWAAAAARETDEETGLQVRLGIPLPDARYTVLAKTGRPSEKVVRYWAAEVVGGHGRTENEIDEVRWMAAGPAHDRLDYARDRDQLRALVRAHHGGRLATWPFVVVRHAKAVARGAWSRADEDRPLDPRGRERAAALVPLLTAYRLERVVTSPSARCRATVQPYAAANGLALRTRQGLSEEGYAEDPTRAPRRMRRLLSRARPVVVCGHGPVLPSMLDVLAERALEEGPARVLADAAGQGMDKGEALVCHVVGAGASAAVVAVERHRV